jgi:hypothetical protein
MVFVGCMSVCCVCVCERSPGTLQPWSDVFGMNEFRQGGVDVFGFLFFVLGSGLESTWTGYDVASSCEMKPGFLETPLPSFFQHNFSANTPCPDQLMLITAIH